LSCSRFFLILIAFCFGLAGLGLLAGALGVIVRITLRWLI
jgi:hypothetical protein